MREIKLKLHKLTLYILIVLALLAPNFEPPQSHSSAIQESYLLKNTDHQDYIALAPKVVSLLCILSVAFIYLFKEIVLLQSIKNISHFIYSFIQIEKKFDCLYPIKFQSKFMICPLDIEFQSKKGV